MEGLCFKHMLCLESLGEGFFSQKTAKARLLHIYVTIGLFPCTLVPSLLLLVKTDLSC